jgi:4-oxalocrotonate tautomerase
MTLGSDEAGDAPSIYPGRNHFVNITRAEIELTMRGEHPTLHIMPLTRIDLIQGKSEQYRSTIGAVVYDALHSALNVPENDRFQVITEHAPSDFIFDPAYLGVQRTPDCVFIQVTLNAGRTVELKQAFYKAVADGLHERLGLRREDVLINLVEVAKENWSFGNGVAQYV